MEEGLHPAMFEEILRGFDDAEEVLGRLSFLDWTVGHNCVLVHMFVEYASCSPPLGTVAVDWKEPCPA